MSYRLFIDDCRNPIDVKWGTIGERKLYREDEWLIARNWAEVLELIVSLGMPKMISFDHDLGDNQPTGYDIAKHIANLIMNAEYELDPEFSILVHSKNPVGAENIRQYMKKFLEVHVNE